MGSLIIIKIFLQPVVASEPKLLITLSLPLPLPLPLHSLKYEVEHPSCFPTLSWVVPQRQRTSKWSVFLNFRGKDTRHDFVHPLHEALRSRGISAFRDDISVNKGGRIRQELFHAIEECRIAIVIFSKNYAASDWCLEELVRIMKRKKLTIFPVFYDVFPSDVRHLRGSFAQAFAKHERNHENEPNKVMTWKQALSDAAEISGFDLRNDVYKRDESKCIQDIVEQVLKKLEAMREEHCSVPVCREKQKLITESLIIFQSRCRLQNLTVSRLQTDVPCQPTTTKVRTKSGWTIVVHMGLSLTIHTKFYPVFMYYTLCQRMTTNATPHLALVRTKSGWATVVHTEAAPYLARVGTEPGPTTAVVARRGFAFPRELLTLLTQILTVCQIVCIILCQPTTTKATPHVARLQIIQAGRMGAVAKATPHPSVLQTKLGWTMILQSGFLLTTHTTVSIMCMHSVLCQQTTKAKPHLAELGRTGTAVVHGGFPFTTHITILRAECVSLMFYVNKRQQRPYHTSRLTRELANKDAVGWGYPHQKTSNHKFSRIIFKRRKSLLFSGHGIIK